MAVALQEGDSSMRTDVPCSYRRRSGQGSYSGRSPAQSRVDNRSTSPGPFNRSPEPAGPSAPPNASTRKDRRSPLLPNVASRSDVKNRIKRRHKPGPSRRKIAVPQHMERQLDWGDSSDIAVWTVSTPPEMKIPPTWTLTPEPPLQAPVSGTFLPCIHQPTGHPGRNAAARSSKASNDNTMKKPQSDASTGCTTSQAADKQSPTGTSRKAHQSSGVENMWRGNQVDTSRHNASYTPCEDEHEALARRRSACCRPTAERGNLMRMFARSSPEPDHRQQDNNQEHKLQGSPSMARSSGARMKVIRLNPSSEPKY